MQVYPPITTLPPLPFVNIDCSADSVPDSAIQLQEAAMFLMPLEISNSTEVAPAATTNILHLQLPEVKCHLLMHKTTEGWEAVNHHFHNSLMPAVLNAPSLSEKYSILTDGVYSYFESTCGTKPVRKPSKKQQPLHNGSLKKVSRKKRIAK